MMEKRQHSRAVVQADITVMMKSSNTETGTEATVFSSHTYDISLGGLMLVVDAPVPVDIPLELKLRFDQGQDFSFMGTVIWNKKLRRDDLNYEARLAGVRLIKPLENPQFPAWGKLIAKILNRPKEGRGIIQIDSK